jgi:hypothetical protein
MNTYVDLDGLDGVKKRLIDVKRERTQRRETVVQLVVVGVLVLVYFSLSRLKGMA